MDPVSAPAVVAAVAPVVLAAASDPVAQVVLAPAVAAYYLQVPSAPAADVPVALAVDPVPGRPYRYPIGSAMVAVAVDRSAHHPRADEGACILVEACTLEDHAGLDLAAAVAGVDTPADTARPEEGRHAVLMVVAEDIQVGTDYLVGLLAVVGLLDRSVEVLQTEREGTHPVDLVGWDHHVRKYFP
mmetsp:Transcript_28117/g.51237  ORF Transcript_28117/g.51237 Transcript_28117/m.51237 type:complete len:186 (-) Transcript_28117:811-1368(-)